ncbi:MAG: AAA domain-containing protein [Saprospiraceae bacterium]|nr:AAA domain-containing protein [Saprospiraceae bacterium]MDW8228971.1 AAA domain-containing protein [Saprospiraceae bacterium]
MAPPKTAYYVHLLELLRQEREEDYRLFLQTVRATPLHERVAQGYTWYPLRIVQTGFALGDRAYVVVERTTHLDEPHQLRAGQVVSLFTREPHVDKPEKVGIIHYIERNRMKIILQARDVPEWLNFGPIGVDMLFDDRSYAEMEQALQRLISAKGDRLAELRDLVAAWPVSDVSLNHASNPANPSQAELADTLFAQESHAEAERSVWEALNPSQRAAVKAILDNRDITVVHGPPGTGKTTVLVAAIRLLCRRENTVLVTAPSNTAADLLTERLAQAGLSVVRIGNISRVDEAILDHTLEGILANHPESRHIKRVKIQAAEYRRQARRYKRSLRSEDRREREHLKSQARELEAWARTLEERLVEQTLTSAQAIVCTLVGAAHPVLEKMRFRTCVIDEAAQALEPACWIPIAKCSRVVLAGDPFQLPPTVKSIEAARKGLNITLIERCISLLPDRVRLLTVQYRMHRAIMDFSNQYFYGGALIAHESAAQRSLQKHLSAQLPNETLSDFGPPANWSAITFVDTAGCGFEERLSTAEGVARNLSRYNPDEALLLREHLLKVLQFFTQVGELVSNTSTSPDAAKLNLPSIGILSPYREQVLQLQTLFRDDAFLMPLLAQRASTPDAITPFGRPEPLITITTIDGFQGQERDIIYISLVRSNPKGDIGFLQDYRRMNVAMTRARKMLVVLGDSATIGNNKFYQAFLDYCSRHGQYRTAWEWMR